MTTCERTGTPALPVPRIASMGYFVALGLLLLVMVGNFYSCLVYMRDAVFYPYGLDYGEGIVWQQMAALASGTMYSDFHEFPFLVFHYTPIYHAVSFLASEAFGNPLAMGRVVSLLSAIGYAALIGTVVGQVSGRETPRVARFAGSLSAFLVLFTFVGVFRWSPVMRVDMLAMFFDMAGVALFLASIKRPRLFYLAAIVFVLAIYTKQNMIPGAFACFLISFLYRFAFTLRVFALAFVVGGGALAGLTAITEGEFIRHIFLYNVNRLEWNNLRVIFGFILSSIIVLELAAVGAYLVAKRIVAPKTMTSLSAWQATLRGHPESVAKLTLLAYLGIVAILSMGILKSGAAYNYLIPAAGVSSIMFGLFVVELTRRSSFSTAEPLGTRSIVATSIMFLFCIWQIFDGGVRGINVPPPEQSRVVQQVLERIEKAPGPVWSEDMVLTRLAGKEVIAEPAIITELAMKGVWDQGPFLDWIRERKFGLIVINTPRHFDSIAKSIEKRPVRFTPELVAAIVSFYPVVETIGDYRIYYPPSNNRK